MITWGLPPLPAMTRGRRNLLVAVAVIDVVVLGLVAAYAWRRAPTSVTVLPADASSPPPVDGSARLAPDATEDNPVCEGCNLLLVSLDIFRPDHLPCNGYPAPTAPALCGFAEQSTVFDNWMVHAYQTPVSMMSMFTGRYPSDSGFTSFSAVLPPTTPYFPEAMKRAGYSTVAMGSSFEVMSDMSSLQQGALSFDHPGLNPGMSFGRGFDRFIFTGQRNVPTDALSWLPAHASERFFLWLVLGTLHWPYGAHGDPAARGRFDPPGYAGPLRALPELGFPQLSRMYDGKLYPENGGPPIALGPDDAAFVNSRYDFGIYTVDRFLADLFASVPAELLQKTVIVIHGVHGEDLGEHKYFGHYDIYDTEVHNTLMVLSPKRKRAGVHIREVTEGIDLGPTLLGLLGLPPLEGATGTDDVAAIRAGHGDPAREAFVERIPLWEDIFRYRSLMPPAYVARISPILDREVIGDTALRTDRWKLIHRRARAVEEQVSWWTELTGTPVRRAAWELYDLEADPTEQHDLAASRPPELAALQADLLAREAAVRLRPLDVDPSP